MSNLNRRDFLKLSGSTLIGVTVGGVALKSIAQERVTESDPMAINIQYVHQSKKEGEYCKNCGAVQNQEIKDWIPCPVVDSKLVNAEGWCVVWVPRTE